MLLLIYGLLAVLLRQAEALAQAPPPPAVVAGHMTNAPAGDTVRLTYGGHLTKAPVDAQGKFRLVLPKLTKPTSASLAYARQRTILYLSPGDELQLTLDFARFDESLRYSGRGAEVNNYLAQSLWRFEYGAVERRPEQQRTPATTPAQMCQLTDTFRQKRRDFLRAYQSRSPLPAAFVEQEQLDFDLERARLLLDYPGYVRYQTKRAASLPPYYYAFLRELPRRQLDAQAMREPVVRFLSAYGGRLLPDGPLSARPAEAQRLYAQATADLGAGRARDWAMFQLLAFQVRDNVAGVLAAYPRFKAENRDSTLARDMRQLLREQLRLQPGQPAPAFTLLDQAGRAVSLESLRGKVVYLDFWGTWCAPCRQEIPALNALARRFSGRDVVFVSIAVNDPQAKWQQVLAAEDMLNPGQIQLHSPNDAVPAAYQVSAFPTYFLLDRQGRINLMPAPRPTAQAEVAAAIEHQLQQP